MSCSVCFPLNYSCKSPLMEWVPSEPEIQIHVKLIIEATFFSSSHLPSSSTSYLISFHSSSIFLYPSYRVPWKLHWQEVVKRDRKMKRENETKKKKSRKRRKWCKASLSNLKSALILFLFSLSHVSFLIPFIPQPLSLHQEVSFWSFLTFLFYSFRFYYFYSFSAHSIFALKIQVSLPPILLRFFFRSFSFFLPPIAFPIPVLFCNCDVGCERERGK